MTATDPTLVIARFTEYAQILQDANAEIDRLIRSEDIPKYKLMDALTPAFADRLEALKQLEVWEPQFHALEPNGMEFGYSHEDNQDAAGNFAAIADSVSGQRWYGSLGEAIAARADDLRWRVPTFIIHRPKPTNGKRLVVDLIGATAK